MTQRLPALLLVAVGTAASTHAHAASFDCQAAKKPMERAICASPKLSALDERLAATYARALHALSPAGAAQLKETQREWLRFAAQACVPRQGAPDTKRVGDCLESAFDERVAQVDQAGVRVGPWMFARIDRYAVTPDPASDTGAHPGMTVHHAAWLQIDAPRDAATAAWNAQLAHDLPAFTPDDDEDDDSDVRLGCASSRVISLSVNDSQYAHGTPHGMFGHTRHSWVMAPTPRKLVAADVFAPRSDWQRRLPAMFLAVYRGNRESTTHLPEVDEAIRTRAVDPGSWLLTPAGLEIAFDADEGGCYACNPGPLTVPWTKLKPLLATPEIAACQAPPERPR